MSIFFDYCPTCRRKTQQEERNEEVSLLGIKQIAQVDVCEECGSHRTSNRHKKYNKRRNKEEINRHVSSLFQALK